MMNMQGIRHSTHLEALEVGGDLPLEVVEDVVRMTGLLNQLGEVEVM